jgi:hypothetical protein
MDGNERQHEQTPEQVPAVTRSLPGLITSEKSERRVDRNDRRRTVVACQGMGVSGLPLYGRSSLHSVAGGSVIHG